MEIVTGGTNAQRVTFLGDTRSGKTCLMQAFLGAPGISSVVVVDSKHLDHEWRQFAETHGYVVTMSPADIRQHALVIFRVDYRSLLDAQGWRKEGSIGWQWTEALQSILWRKNTLAVFDEAMHVLPSKMAHPEARRIFTQGAGQGIASWVASQAPLHVDTVALAQSEHMIAFAQTLPEYQADIRRRRGVDAAPLGELGKYEWAHHEKGRSDWDFYDPISIVKKRTTRAPSEYEPTPA